MKIFEVKIDNDPGGWKSGGDDKYLVIAKTPEEAIEKIKNGWSYNWGNGVYTYSQNPDKARCMPVYISQRAKLSAQEIRFADYDVHIKNHRQAKLDRIEKNVKRNEEK